MGQTNMESIMTDIATSVRAAIKQFGGTDAQADDAALVLECGMVGGVATLIATGTALNDPKSASKLYAAAACACAAMGYRAVQTYTLEREPGTSLAAAGWVRADKVAVTNWGKTSRRGKARVTVEPRWRWLKSCGAPLSSL
jgi:hypothetical protein